MQPKLRRNMPGRCMRFPCHLWPVPVVAPTSWRAPSARNSVRCSRQNIRTATGKPRRLYSLPRCRGVMGRCGWCDNLRWRVAGYYRYSGIGALAVAAQAGRFGLVAASLFSSGKPSPGRMRRSRCRKCAMVLRDFRSPGFCFETKNLPLVNDLQILLSKKCIRGRGQSIYVASTLADSPICAGKAHL